MMQSKHVGYKLITRSTWARLCLAYQENIKFLYQHMSITAELVGIFTLAHPKSSQSSSFDRTPTRETVVAKM